MQMPVDNRLVRTILSQAKTRLIEAAFLAAFLLIAGIAAFLAVTVFSARTAHAENLHLTADASYTLPYSGQTFEILAGSSYQSIAVGDRDATLVLGDGDSVFLRRPESSRGKFINNIGLDECRYLNGTNVIWVDGPRSVIIEPSSQSCSSSDTSKAYAVEVGDPDGGEILGEGDQKLILWQNVGDLTASANILLSLDGGNSYTETIASGIVSQGYYDWTVPLVTTTEHARIMVQAVDNGQIVAADVSDADFTINGLTPPVPYVPEEATFSAGTIGEDLGLVPYTTGTGQVVCLPETRIKGTSSAAVYYCGPDGKRHAFPNQRIHDTWYQGFAGVITLTDAELAQVQLGANVRYRPGVKMVKITTDPKVYAVDAGGVLRWVTTEDVAKRLYGTDWNRMIDDVPDAFFADYTIGDPIE